VSLICSSTVRVLRSKESQSRWASVFVADYGCHWSYSTSVFRYHPMPSHRAACRRVGTHWSSTTSGTQNQGCASLTHPTHFGIITLERVCRDHFAAGAGAQAAVDG
jgi:hypothetical protein